MTNFVLKAFVPAICLFYSVLPLSAVADSKTTSFGLKNDGEIVALKPDLETEELEQAVNEYPVDIYQDLLDASVNWYHDRGTLSEQLRLRVLATAIESKDERLYELALESAEEAARWSIPLAYRSRKQQRKSDSHWLEYTENMAPDLLFYSYASKPAILSEEGQSLLNIIATGILSQLPGAEHPDFQEFLARKLQGSFEVINELIAVQSIVNPGSKGILSAVIVNSIIASATEKPQALWNFLFKNSALLQQVGQNSLAFYERSLKLSEHGKMTSRLGYSTLGFPVNAIEVGGFGGGVAAVVVGAITTIPGTGMITNGYLQELLAEALGVAESLANSEKVTARGIDEDMVKSLRDQLTQAATTQVK